MCNINIYQLRKVHSCNSNNLRTVEMNNKSPSNLLPLSLRFCPYLNFLFFIQLGEILPRKSTSDEVREHKTSLPNDVTAAPKPTNHSTPIVSNHNNTAPRVTNAPNHVAPSHVKQTSFAPPNVVPPQPAPRKLSHPNGQVRFWFLLTLRTET